MLKLSCSLDFDPKKIKQVRILPEKDWSKEYTFEIEFDERGILDVSLWFDFIAEDIINEFSLPSDAIIFTAEDKQKHSQEAREKVQEIYRDPSNPAPYTRQALDYVATLKDIIKKMAKEMGVHPIAVAGAIADEYSTYDRFDEVQDTILAGMPDYIFVDYMHTSQAIKSNPPVKWVLEVIKTYDAELGKR